MYVEPKEGLIDGAEARIGWVTFSKSGKSIYYRGKSLMRANGISGNYLDNESGQEYWVSGIKRRGSNVHLSERRLKVVVDDDALADYMAGSGATLDYSFRRTR